jgi:lipoprotein-anchoring transpeptidase ErfK/SrfK
LRLGHRRAARQAARFCKARHAFRFARLHTISCVLIFAAAATLSSAQAPARTDAPALELQVLLDRAGFSSGEIDGVLGRNTKMAVAAFREARKIAQADEGDVANVMEALRAEAPEIVVPYTIEAADVAGPFTPNIPADLLEQSKLPALVYRSAQEALAEKFHVAPALLAALNPGAQFTAGESIRVPNVIAAAPAEGQKAAKVIVSKSASTARALDAQGQILFHAPVTSGSEHDPLPLGDWTVTAVLKNPTFIYNPDLFWDADPSHSKAKIAAGPNNPVGVVWIDIDRPHYGLHGTPEPSKVGHTSSHGCVRLTNWDATRLAAMVGKGTPVVFAQ